jgi:hypothetical protein
LFNLQAHDKPLSGSIVQRLQRFALREPFKRKALASIANEIAQAVEQANTEDCTDFDQQLRLAELKSLFSRLDTKYALSQVLYIAAAYNLIFLLLYT